MTRPASRGDGATVAMREHEAQHADGQVDGEDPAPPHRGGQHTAHERARGGRHARDRAPQPEGPRPGRRRAVDLLQQGQRAGHQQCGAAALQQAERREREGAPRDRAAEGRDGEQGHARGRTPGGGPSGRPARRRGAAGPRTRPCSRRRSTAGRQRRAEVAPDRGRGHVDDGDVQDDHEVAAADREQRRQPHGGTRARPRRPRCERATPRPSIEDVSRGGGSAGTLRYVSPTVTAPRGRFTGAKRPVVDPGCRVTPDRARFRYRSVIIQVRSPGSRCFPDLAPRQDLVDGADRVSALKGRSPSCPCDGASLQRRYWWSCPRPSVSSRRRLQPAAPPAHRTSRPTRSRRRLPPAGGSLVAARRCGASPSPITSWRQTQRR